MRFSLHAALPFVAAMILSAPVCAQDGPVRLSPRELAAAECVRLRDGSRACRVGDGGIPWLFGAGSVYGKAGGEPTVNGRADSILRSTSSNGLVPGQDPE